MTEKNYIATAEERSLCHDVEQFISVAEENGYLLERDPVTIKIGSFCDKAVFRQVWFYKKPNLCLAFTKYAGKSTDWNADDETISSLLELKADERLRLPAGTKMLDIVQKDDADYKVVSSLLKTYQFVRLARGPDSGPLQAALPMRIYSLIFAKNGDKDTPMYKVYATCAKDATISDLLIAIAERIVE